MSASLPPDLPLSQHGPVRPLTPGDAPAFARLCERHPLRFLTPRLNIEAHGFQGPVLRSWGAFDPAGAEMLGILFRFTNTVVAVDADGACAPAFAAVIDRETGIAGIRGAVETVSGLQAALRRYTPADWEDSFFLRLLRPPACPPETLALARR